MTARAGGHGDCVTHVANGLDDREKLPIYDYAVRARGGMGRELYVSQTYNGTRSRRERDA